MRKRIAGTLSGASDAQSLYLVGTGDEGTAELATFADDLQMVVVPITRGETSDTMLAVAPILGERATEPELTRVDGTYQYALIRPRGR